MRFLTNEVSEQGFTRISDKVFRGESDRFYLRVNKGQVIRLNASTESPREDIKIQLVSENGKILDRSDDFLSSKASSITWRASKDETISIIVKSDSKDIDFDGIDYDLYIDNLSLGDDFSSEGKGLPKEYLLKDFLFPPQQRDLISQFWGGNELLELNEIADIILSVVKDDRVVSAQDIAALQDVGDHLSKHVDPANRDYYQYIYDAIVKGNPANREWNGGKIESVELGDLKIGSSRSQLVKLVDKWIYGEDEPAAYTQGDSAQGLDGVYSFDYGVANGPVFDGTANYLQVAQGLSASCYLLAAMMDLTNRNQDLFQDLFQDNGNGTYGIRFYGNDGQPIWVTVDSSEFPLKDDGGLAFAGSHKEQPGNYMNPDTNVLWASILEKAYAQANAIGKFGRSDSSNSYRAIDYGAADVFRHLGGNYFSEEFSIITYDPVTGFLNQTTGQPVSSPSEELKSALADRDGIIVASFENIRPKDSDLTTFAKQHAYMVANYNSETDMFTIANPWGSAGAYWLPTFEVSSSGLDALTMQGYLSPWISDFAQV